MRVIYGINPVMEALKADKERVEKILLSETRLDRLAAEIAKAAVSKGVTVERVSPKRLGELAGTARHQGVVAVIAGVFGYRDIEDLIAAWKATGEEAFFMILDSIQDPQNLGSLIRAADAADAHGIIIPKDRACEVTPAAVKASAGAAVHVPVARETNLTRAIQRLKEENIWVAAIEADCKDTIYTADLKRDIAIVIGSEGKGIRRLVRENCDLCLSIPMAGKLNSLNSAQAGAIAAFEIRRQRLPAK